MRKESKVNPMWFVLLITLVVMGGMVYVETGDISYAVSLVGMVIILCSGAAIVLFVAAASVFVFMGEGFCSGGVIAVAFRRHKPRFLVRNASFVGGVLFIHSRALVSIFVL